MKMNFKQVRYSFLIAGLLAGSVLCQTEKTNSLDSETIMSLIGMRLNKVFSTCGFPDNVYGTGIADNVDAGLEYTSFGFKIKNKAVTLIFFWNEWRKPIRGISFDDNESTIIGKLGSQYKSSSNSNGTRFLAWELKDLDSYLIIYINNDGTIKRITVELK